MPEHEFYCEEHQKEFKDQKGLNVHLTKVHNKQNKQEDNTTKPDEPIDIDRLAKSIKASGFFDFLFRSWAKKYNDDSLLLKPEEASLIDGAIADSLAAMPDKWLRKLMKLIPFFPILMVVAPIFMKRLGVVLQKSKEEKKPAEPTKEENPNV